MLRIGLEKERNLDRFILLLKRCHFNNLVVVIQTFKPLLMPLTANFDLADAIQDSLYKKVPDQFNSLITKSLTEDEIKQNKANQEIAI